MELFFVGILIFVIVIVVNNVGIFFIVFLDGFKVDNMGLIFLGVSKVILIDMGIFIWVKR